MGGKRPSESHPQPESPHPAPQPCLVLDAAPEGQVGRAWLAPFEVALVCALMNDLEPKIYVYAPNGASDCSHGWSGAAAKPPPRSPWNGSRILSRPASGDGEVNATGGVADN
jgi:hypothetical protein